jgi:hypothetical protein
VILGSIDAESNLASCLSASKGAVSLPCGATAAGPRSPTSWPIARPPGGVCSLAELQIDRIQRASRARTGFSPARGAVLRRRVRGGRLAFIDRAPA